MCVQFLLILITMSAQYAQQLPTLEFRSAHSPPVTRIIIPKHVSRPLQLPWDPTVSIKHAQIARVASMFLNVVTKGTFIQRVPTRSVQLAVRALPGHIFPETVMQVQRLVKPVIPHFAPRADREHIVRPLGPHSALRVQQAPITAALEQPPAHQHQPDTTRAALRGLVQEQQLRLRAAGASGLRRVRNCVTP